MRGFGRLSLARSLAAPHSFSGEGRDKGEGQAGTGRPGGKELILTSMARPSQRLPLQANRP